MAGVGTMSELKEVWDFVEKGSSGTASLHVPLSLTLTTPTVNPHPQPPPSSSFLPLSPSTLDLTLNP